MMFPMQSPDELALALTNAMALSEREQAKHRDLQVQHFPTKCVIFRW